SHVDPIAGAICCGRPEDRAGRYGLGEEAAADTAEPVPIEEIGTGILAERKQQCRTPASPGHIDRQWVGAAEIGITIVERAPVGWREIALRIVIAMQIGGQAKDRLTVAPGRNIERIAGGNKQRAAVAGDPARRPDPPSPSTRAPANDIAGIAQANAGDPAAIVPAIAVMPAIGHIDPAVEDGQRAALVLRAG